MAATKLFQQVLRLIKQHHMFGPTDQVLIAISGGPDSVALTSLLLEIKQHYWPNLSLTLAHLNHQLRAAESDRDEQFVQTLAQQLNLKLILERVDVAQAAHQENLEAMARQLRYQFLQRAAQTVVAQAIATGHNMNDQAETLLMRLLRGSGPQGLAGIFPVVSPANPTEIDQPARIVRPLLATKRIEIEQYLQAQQLSSCLDSSNENLDFTRNKIRHQLMPQLAQLNPRVIETLSRTAELMRHLNQKHQTAARQTGNISASSTRTELNKNSSRKNFAIDSQLQLFNSREQSELSARELEQLPVALRHEQLRIAIVQVRGDLRRISAAHIASIDTLLAVDKSGKRVLLPGGFEVAREFDRIIIRQQRQSQPLLPQQSLCLGGSCQFGQFLVNFQTTCEADWPLLKATTHFAELVDLKSVGEELSVRSRKPGDRYQPAGHQQREKLKNLMIENRISLTQRDSWPVVTTADDRIVWSPGLPVAQSFTVDATTAYFAIILAKC